MKKTVKNGVIYFILCSILFVAIFFAGIDNITAVNAADASSVTNSLSDIAISIENTENSDIVVEDNVVNGSLLAGKYYKVTIDWRITSDKFYNIVKSGDYFEINLDDSCFSFNDSLSESDLIYNNMVIGKWKVQDNQIICTFTDGCEQFMEVSGYFEVYCYCIRQDRADANVNIGGVQLTIPLNPASTGFPYADNPDVTWNYGLLSKLGNHDTDDTTVDWYIYGNYDNALAVYTGQTAATIENVVIKDVLPDDLIVDTIRVNTPINHPKDNDTLSNKSAFKLDITEQFTNINEEDTVNGAAFESQSEWEEYINNHPLTYGSSKDQKTILVNLGTLPDSLKMADNADDFKTKISAAYIHFTEDELNAVADIYNINGEYPVYAFQVYIKAKSSNDNGIFSKEEYTNTAYLTCNSNSESAESPSLKINYLTGGIEASERKSATLTKKDADTLAPIEGASFKLQQYNNSAWEDYTPESETLVKDTDSNGQVTYTNLGPGTYRFVEVEAAEGYDISSVIYSENQFVILSSDTEGKMITATNKKTSQGNAPTEGTTTEQETSSTEAPTSEQETSSTEETTPSGAANGGQDNNTNVEAGNAGKVTTWLFVTIALGIMLLASFFILMKKNSNREC